MPERRQEKFLWKHGNSVGPFVLGSPVRQYRNLDIQYDETGGYYWCPEFEELYLYPEDNAEDNADDLSNLHQFNEDNVIAGITSEKYFYYKNRNLVGRNIDEVISLLDCEPDLTFNLTRGEDITEYKQYKVFCFSSLKLALWSFENVVERCKVVSYYEE